MGHQGNESHPTAPGFDNIGADHGIAGIVGALHEDVGGECLDHVERRRFIEQHHPVDRGETGDDPGPLGFGNEWAAGSLAKRPDLGIGVEPDHQGST